MPRRWPAEWQPASRWIDHPARAIFPPMRIRRNLVATLMLAACLGACEEEQALDDDLISVTILQDVFEFEVTGLDKMTGSRRFFWTMTGNQATVDITPGLTDGNAFLQIRGADSEVVYAEDIESEIDGPVENFPGIWQLDIVIEKASGEFAIRLERVEPEPEPEPEPPIAGAGQP